MTEQEMLEQLQDLIEDRNAFIKNDGSDFFKKDKVALEMIIERYLKQKIQCFRRDI